MSAIKAARIAADLQQQEVAARAGVSIATVSKFENDIPIGVEPARRILEALGLEWGTVEVSILEKRKRIRRK